MSLKHIKSNYPTEAARSKEMATSSEELASQAEYLKNIVSIFDVGDI